MRIISLVLLFATSSCVSMFFPSAGSQKSKIYQYNPPRAPWHTIESRVDDVAFQNADTKDVITIYSVCGQYQDQSLEELTKNVIVGIEERKSTEQKEFTIDSMSAMETKLIGKTDGQPIAAIFTVIRSATCVYDIIYASKPEQFEKGAEDYHALIASFKEDRK